MGAGRSQRVEKRTVELTDLVTNEILRVRLGWPNGTTVHRRMERSGFPDPIARLSRMKIWHWPDVVEWCRVNEVSFIDPTDLVELAVIEERLQIGYSDLSESGLAAVSVVDGVEKYLWMDVEALASELLKGPPA